MPMATKVTDFCFNIIDNSLSSCGENKDAYHFLLACRIYLTAGNDFFLSLIIFAQSEHYCYKSIVIGLYKIAFTD